MTEENLLWAILEKPNDDTARLIYADWLEEHGQDVRAQFIRLQLSLAKGPGCDRFMYSCGENTPLHDLPQLGCQKCKKWAIDWYAQWHYKDWWIDWCGTIYNPVYVSIPIFDKGPFIRGGGAGYAPEITYVFDRGLVDEVYSSSYWLQNNLWSLFRKHPIRKVGLTVEPTRIGNVYYTQGWDSMGPIMGSTPEEAIRLLSKEFVEHGRSLHRLDP